MKKQIILFLMILTGLTSKSQDTTQTRGFINKSHIAINKVQKELMQLSDKSAETDFKEAIKYQVASVKYFRANKQKESFESSFKSRIICTEILGKINKKYVDFFNPTETEKQLITTDYKSIILNNDLFNQGELDKINKFNIAEIQKLRELEINLN